MCGHALRGRRRRTFGRLDDRADGLGRALRERRRRSVLLLRMDDLSHRAPLSGRLRRKRRRSPGLPVPTGMQAGSPAGAPDTAPSKRAQSRPGAIPGPSMWRRSPWLRCLRGRRPDDHHDGAGPLVCPVDATRAQLEGRPGRWPKRRDRPQTGPGPRQGRPTQRFGGTAANAKIECWRP
jgi:hypothetical protein